MSEKLCWLSWYWRDHIKAKLADKYQMRDWVVKEKGLPEDLLVPLLGVYKRAEEIDYDKLPDSFVLKCNHGCGYNILVPDKKKLDIDAANRQLNAWLEEYYDGGIAEFHYKDIHQHLILVEQYLGDPLSEFPPQDFKVRVSYGEPKWTVCCFDRDEKGEAQYATFDNNWKQLFLTVDEKVSSAPRPKMFDKMLEYSSVLGRDFPFVRVDFYEVDGHIYLGELTFTPMGNMDIAYPNDKDKLLGNSITLPPKRQDKYCYEK